MKRLIAVLVVVAVVAGIVVPVLVQGGTASACEVGLTPGYWKNHTEVWDNDPLGSWAGRPLPTDLFDEVFGVTGGEFDNYVDPPHLPLLDVLRTGGGKFDALNRHAVAALLNRANFGYPAFYSYSFIKGKVQYAYSTGDWQSVKDLLEDANELGVPGD